MVLRKNSSLRLQQESKGSRGGASHTIPLTTRTTFSSCTQKPAYMQEDVCTPIYNPLIPSRRDAIISTAVRRCAEQVRISLIINSIALFSCSLCCYQGTEEAFCLHAIYHEYNTVKLYTVQCTLHSIMAIEDLRKGKKLN